jgi:phytoene/squalene synthetase
MSVAALDTSLKTADPDRRMAALFATADVRDRLLGLYAFNHEIARIAEASTESMIGEMKLTWWRDAVADLYAEPQVIRRHDVTEALAPLTATLDLADLKILIQARFDDIAAKPFADLDDVLAYVDNTSGQLMKLGLTLAGVELDANWTRDAGRAWGLTGLLRAFAPRARIGRAPVGMDALDEAGVTLAMLAQGLGEDKLKPALTPVVDAAQSACAALKARGALPAEAVPVLGYAVLASGYLNALPAGPYQIAAERSMLARQLRLSWCSLTGC